VSTTTSFRTTCPACGSALPDGVSEKQCPACLLRAGMAAETMPSGLEDLPDEMSESPEDTRKNTLTPADREAPGTMIGRYRLLQEIGEGGFGIVYLAEQQEPVKRRVALKVLKPGMDTREVVARFEAERQALALMDHPHIAQVFDGGATGSGRPYFVMELVEGTPLTKYCDARRLTTRQRLDLFLDVLAAVQHAHQKGIIHRDLKPSNILVRDGSASRPGAAAAGAQGDAEIHPRVKVIDFGIAKAVGAELSQRTHCTGAGAMIGTPQYMSPEQAETHALDVDTRSDIYSLGAVLFELLTGRTPLDSSRMRGTSLAEVQRMIREQEPPRPSAVATAMSLPDRTRVARRRGTDAGRLTSQIRGDLDWLVMKALEKDRTRRYETATGFARDIRRYLDDEPVSASPPSLRYRFGKFARRHRFAVAWTAAVCLLVLTSAVAMTFLFFWANRERLNAERLTSEALATQMDLQRVTWEALAMASERKGEGRRAGVFTALRRATRIGEAMAVEANRKRLQSTAIAALAMVDMTTLPQWEGNPGYGELIASSPGLSHFARSFPDGRIEVLRLAERKVIAAFPGRGAAVQWIMRFSSGGETLAAAHGTSEGLRLTFWAVSGGHPPVDAGPVVKKACDFFPDGTRCAVGRPIPGGQALDIISVSTGGTVRHFPLSELPHSVSVSRDGTLVALSYMEANLVEVRDAHSGAVVASFSVPFPAALAFGPADDSLAVCSGSEQNEIFIWAAGDWQSSPLKLTGHSRRPDAVAWSHDGRFLATTGWDNTVCLWDPLQGTLLCWCDGRASALTFSADGRNLGLLRDGKSVWSLEVEPGNVCYRGAGHHGGLGTHGAAWNGSATLMAACGDDGVSLWNREGRRLATLKIPESRGVAFFEGSLFITSREGVSEWRLDPVSGENGLAFSVQKVRKLENFAVCEQLAIAVDSPPKTGDRATPPRFARLAVIDKRKGAGNATVWTIDLLDNLRPAQIGQLPNAAFCSLSGDGRWLAAGTWKGSGVRVWSLENRDSPPIDLPAPGAATVAFAPDDRWLVTGDTEAYRFWNPVSWQCEHVVPNGGMGESYGRMAFSPRTTVAAVACRKAEFKLLLLLGKPQELTAPDFDREAPLCFDPTGMLMVNTGLTGVFFWKVDTIRSELARLGLDFEELKDHPFPALSLPVVRRILVTPGSRP
jgi:serine/threonine protein kinase/WD40 repeat protein